MYIIDAEFYKFSEINLLAVMCEIGVYVFWGEGKKKSLWIGEGELMQRLFEHSYKFRWKDGYVSIIPNKNKIESSIVEYALLNHAKEIGRFPTVNKQRGMEQIVIDALKKLGKIKVNMRYRNPLIAPSGNNRLHQSYPIYLTLPS